MQKLIFQNFTIKNIDLPTNLSVAFKLKKYFFIFILSLPISYLPTCIPILILYHQQYNV